MQQLKIYEDTNNHLVYIIKYCILLMKEYKDSILKLRSTSAAFIFYKILEI